MALIVLLAACRREAVSSPRLEAPDHTTASIPQVATYPLADTPGYLVYIQGERLMMLDPTPRLLADGIAPEMVFSSPDQRHLLFSRPEGRRHILFAADAATHDHRLLATLQSLQWEPRAWSPDGLWAVIVTGSALDVVAVDGSTHFAEVGSVLADVLWTNDERLLVLDRGTARTYDSATLIDLWNGTRQTLGIDLQTLAGEWDVLLATLATMDIFLVATPLDLFGNQYSLRATQSSGLCQTWEVVSLTGHVAYRVEDTYRLTNLAQLATGDWLFLQWMLPECQLGIPQVALWSLAGTGDTAKSVVDGVFGGIGFSQLSSRAPLYALAPSRQSVIWVGGGLETYRTSLHYLNLATDEQAVLYEEQLDRRSSGAGEFIVGVFWLIQ